eukprot:398924-Hanusia_phi.AAC.1
MDELSASQEVSGDPLFKRILRRSFIIAGTVRGCWFEWRWSWRDASPPPARCSEHRGLVRGGRVAVGSVLLSLLRQFKPFRTSPIVPELPAPDLKLSPPHPSLYQV